LITTISVMTTDTHNTVLTPELRTTVASDSSIGGNLLPSMLAINPYPDELFIQSLTPVPHTDGETRTEFSSTDHPIQSRSVWYWAQAWPKDRVACFCPTFDISCNSRPSPSSAPSPAHDPQAPGERSCASGPA
jgi:hypothetical protein